MWRLFLFLSILLLSTSDGSSRSISSCSTTTLFTKLPILSSLFLSLSLTSSSSSSPWAIPVFTAVAAMETEQQKEEEETNKNTAVDVDQDQTCANKDSTAEADDVDETEIDDGTTTDVDDVNEYGEDYDYYAAFEEEEEEEEEGDDGYYEGFEHDCPEDDEDCVQQQLGVFVWNAGNFSDIKKFLKCGESTTDQSRYVIPTDWNLFLNTYREVMKDIPEEDKTAFDYDNHVSGFKVPVEVQYTESMGRGVFAAADIAKGTFILKTKPAEFKKPNLFLEYVRALPPDNACDIFHWVFASRTTRHTYSLCVELDEGSFVNACFENEKEDCNIGALDEHKKLYRGCYMEYYALRDISKGEQLLLDYNELKVI